MNDAILPKTISELADHLERIREELFSIQRSLEKMEPIEAAVESAHTPNKGAVGC
jgi:dynactin complex subunit